MPRLALGAHHGALRRLALASAWNGVMIVGVTTWAMSFAQQAFPATTAALAYATVWGHIHSIKRQLRTSHPTHPSPCAAAAAGAAIRRPHRRAPHARAALGVQLVGGALVISANLVAAKRL